MSKNCVIAMAKELLKELYLATNQSNLYALITKANTMPNEEVEESLTCIKKLIQFSASGYVQPPLDFQKILDEVIKELKIQN